MTYFEWLIFLICQNDRERVSYQKVFKQMLETDFIPIVHNDENRAADGVNLRLLFEDETGETCEKFGECSILEMMVALALRCENDIMYDPDEGDRTSVWFWEMMDNLGLSEMTNENFDGRFVKRVLDILNRREYSRNGEGGLFYVHDIGAGYDMRTTELWYQLMYWLNTHFQW